MRWPLRGVLLTTGFVLLTACERQGAAPPAAPPAEVVVSTPLAREVVDELLYTGSTQALDTTEVRPRVTGFIEAVKFQPLDIVKSGQVLFEIDAREFRAARDRAQGDVTLREAMLRRATFEFNKLEEIRATGAVSEQEYADAMANRDGAAAALTSAQATLANAALQLEWCSVTAPIGGRISRDYFRNGDLVVADQTVLAEIVDDGRVYVYFNISERDLLTLRERGRVERAGGDPAASQPELRELRWRVEIGLMTESGYPHVGVIDYAAPQVDPTTGTLQVRAVFENANRVLVAGLFVRVRVPIGAPYTALTVNERALGSDQGQRFLLVVNDKDQVERRPVGVGTLRAGLRVITEGLQPSERVIVEGLQRVRPGLTVKPVVVPMPTGPAGAARPVVTTTSAPAAGH